MYVCERERERERERRGENERKRKRQKDKQEREERYTIHSIRISCFLPIRERISWSHTMEPFVELIKGENQIDFLFANAMTDWASESELL